MNRKFLSLALCLIFVPFLYCALAHANETAAGIAATGLYFREEKNISIEQEDLYISENKIEVTYLFKNHSNQDIETEIAFPIPNYYYDISGNTFYPMYDDFTVEVNGNKFNYQEEVRAFLKKVECTKLLADIGISAKNFGYMIHDPLKRRPPDEKEDLFANLTEQQKQILLKNKLVKMEGNRAIPAWTVSREYHWTQLFPANNTITIKHSYRPYKSYDVITDTNKFISETCPDKEILAWLNDGHGPKYYRYIDYILTTANNWKQPIKTFNLTVDSGSQKIRKQHGNIYVSSCFEQKLNKIAPTLFKAYLSDFKPSKELTVYFIGR